MIDIKKYWKIPLQYQCDYITFFNVGDVVYVGDFPSKKEYHYFCKVIKQTQAGK